MSGGYNTGAAARYEMILSMLRKDIAAPARVVELGAAPGEQSIGLAQEGYEVTAVDIGVASDAWEGVAEGTMAARFASAGIDLVLWNLEEIPYPLADEAFDAVVMTEVFEHLREYPATSLVETRRILRPGGLLYFTTPNSAYIRNRVQLMLGRSVATKLSDWIGGLPFARHAREYTFDEVEHLIRHAGLEPILVTGRHLHVASGRTSLRSVVLKRVIDRIAQIRPSLGPSIVVVARRPL